MTAVSYVPPNVPPPVVQSSRPCSDASGSASLCLRRRRSRATGSPTRPRIMVCSSRPGSRTSARCRYTCKLPGRADGMRGSRLRHSRTCEEEAHPFKEGWRIRCCYMSAGDTTNVSRWSRNAIRHLALSVTGGAQQSLRHRRLKSTLRPIDQAASLFARKMSDFDK